VIRSIEVFARERTVAAKRAPSAPEAARSTRPAAPGVLSAPLAFGAQATGERGVGVPEPLRAKLERSMGVDLGGVRLHTDPQANAAATAVAAQAFTTGQNIYFRAGHFE